MKIIAERNIIIISRKKIGIIKYVPLIISQCRCISHMLLCKVGTVKKNTNILYFSRKKNDINVTCIELHFRIRFYLGDKEVHGRSFHRKIHQNKSSCNFCENIKPLTTSYIFFNAVAISQQRNILFNDTIKYLFLKVCIVFVLRIYNVESKKMFLLLE